MEPTTALDMTDDIIKLEMLCIRELELLEVEYIYQKETVANEEQLRKRNTTNGSE